MLEGIVGEDVFRAGVTLYLRKFEYGNAVTKDLWAALTEAAESAGQSIDVERVMDTWTLQMGLPVVDVQYNSITGRAILRQKRFFATPSAEKKAAALKETSPFS
jgi:aminopeptidase N